MSPKFLWNGLSSTHTHFRSIPLLCLTCPLILNFFQPSHFFQPNPPYPIYNWGVQAMAKAYQDFPNSIKDWNSPSGGNQKFCWGCYFTGWSEAEEEWFWLFEPFSELQRTFCKYWASIKIKISITCVYKEYKVKFKMVQQHWLQLKMKFYWVITWKLLFSGEN